MITGFLNRLSTKGLKMMILLFIELSILFTMGILSMFDIYHIESFGVFLLHFALVSVVFIIMIQIYHLFSLISYRQTHNNNRGV